MSLDPEQRLEALRREVAAEGPAPSSPPSPPATPPTPLSPAPPLGTVPAMPAMPPTSQVLDPGPSGPARTTDAPSASDGWDIRELLADASLTTWLGLGLLALGGYLVLSWLVPGVDLIGTLVLLGAGVLLLAQHLMRGGAPWTLYAGAILTGIGGARLVGTLLPGSWHGLTAIGVGAAFLAIGYLRHSQAGGYGWQGILGGAVLGLGLIQLVLGWLPGAPGVFDLVLPAVLLLAGALLLLRTRGSVGGDRRPTR